MCPLLPSHFPAIPTKLRILLVLISHPSLPPGDFWRPYIGLKYHIQAATQANCRDASSVDPRLPAGDKWQLGTVVAKTNILAQRVTTATEPFAFTMAGQYRLCFYDEDFRWATHGYLWPTAIDVSGVYHTTILVGWPTTNVFHCYLIRGGHNNPADTYTEKSSCTITYSGTVRKRDRSANNWVEDSVFCVGRFFVGCGCN